MKFKEYTYYPAQEILNEYGIELNASNLQYYLAAKRCCMFPAFFHESNQVLHFHAELFFAFKQYCEIQSKIDYSGSKLILLSKIKTDLDYECPFDFTELGIFYNLGALQGIINKSGRYKRKKQIYEQSYWDLKFLQEVTYGENKVCFNNMGDTIYH